VLIFLILVCSFLRGEPADFFILKNREGAGMFSMFSDVLALLHSYDSGICKGVEVNFENEGFYYDPSHGPNWWNYYCEPICLGEKKKVRTGVYGSFPRVGEVSFYKNRQEAFDLIQKYIHFRPHILEKVEQFQDSYFQDHYMIGVHYRGTDNPESSPAYEKYLQEMGKVIEALPDYRFFLATDEQPFIDFMKSAFPGRICYQLDAYRSTRGGTPLHMNPLLDHWKQGEEAILDCLLLSKCSLLMLTYSNVSLWAALLNPQARVINMSKKSSIK
jgi:hypothetical protein